MKKGFTLIELLVVIAIVAILAGIVFAGLSKARNSARQSRANAEISQIQKAAERVFIDYGYYPADSNATGSIVCPKDIVVDSATGKLFGTYISACNDPWGRPYRWDNVCGSGALRGSGGTCPAYSDSDPGPVGVTVMGSNGISDNCADGTDDTCAGTRGHLVYQGVVTTEGGPFCASDISSCAGLSNEACYTRNFCFVNPDSCVGAYPTTANCNTLNVAGCTPAGCGVNVSGDCGGTPNDCTSRTGNQVSCQNAGCTYGGPCGGVPAACSTKVTSPTCVTQGCSWNACTGANGFNCGQFLTNATCQLAGTTQRTVCSYTGGVCVPKTCATFNNSAANCGLATGCVYTPNCSGNPSACSTKVTAPTCATVTGCTWPATNCSGSPSACSTYNTVGTCGTGCAWNDTSTCQGTYNLNANCTDFNAAGQATCNSTAGCTWTLGTCTGTAQSCSGFDQNTCGAQTGCSWHQ